jgi:hypothetical protein
MENNKKNYLFRLGPVLFFPKSEVKPPAYKDSFEEYRNIGRFGIMLIYGIFSYHLFRDFNESDAIFNGPVRPTSYYLLFLIPGFFSLIDIYLVWLEKKTKIPMNKVSKYFIYGAWLISAIFYSIYIYHYLLVLR